MQVSDESRKAAMAFYIHWSPVLAISEWGREKFRHELAELLERQRIEAAASEHVWPTISQPGSTEKAAERP